MKRIFIIIILLPVICFGAWDKDKPASSTSLRSSNPEILANFSALESTIGAFHEFSTGGSNTGEAISVKFNAPISTPTNVANKGFLYGKDVSAVIELHWLDESGTELQITSGGDLYSSNNLTIVGTSTFTGAVTANGGITLGAGNDLIGSATSDITFNTNKFTVAGDTGNTVIAGTCDITGATEITGIATLGDGSLTKTTAAPSTDAMIANKKYVDTGADSVIKAWVKFDGSNGASPTILASLNVASVVRNSTGVYTITWATDFGSTHYACVPVADSPRYASTETYLAGSAVVHSLNSSGTLTDSAKLSVIAIGAQ